MKTVTPPQDQFSRGQATVEYILMMAAVVVIFSAFLTAFHADVVHYLFSFIGQLLPETQ